MKCYDLEEIFNMNELITYRFIYRTSNGQLIAAIQCATNVRTDELSIMHNPSVRTHGQYFKNELEHCEKDRYYYAALFKIGRDVFITYRGSSYAIEIPRVYFNSYEGAIPSASRQLAGR